MKNIGTLRYLRPSQIGMSCIHYFLSMMNVSHANLRILNIFLLISSINRMFQLFLVAVLEFL